MGKVLRMLGAVWPHQPPHSTFMQNGPQGPFCMVQDQPTLQGHESAMTWIA
jgi:hypothetical protein